jgi:hypothetical protein
MTAEDLEALREAKHALEHPGLAAKITNALGVPVEKALGMLPDRWSGPVSRAAHSAIATALHIAAGSLKNTLGGRAGNRLHKALVVVTGAGSGAFGLPALAIELPVSTTIMLRSIAAIARSQGEDLSDIHARLACLEVFALGGRPGRGDASEAGYYAARSAFGKVMVDAARYIGERGLAREGAPPVMRLIMYVAERFGIQVSEKLAAQAVPVIGAAGGALINYLFIDHFQKMARGHFTVRRLERIYGEEHVRREYLGISEDTSRPSA